MTDAIKNSVTREDHPDARTNGLPISVIIGPAQWGGLLEGVKGATGLPPWGHRGRDVILSQTPLIENMWASALNTALTRWAAQGWAITDEGESATRMKRAQQMLLAFDGNWHTGIKRHLADYLTTDNGAFLEIVRASSAPGARVVGLVHLDALRCYRTGDPERPVYYQDVQGRLHELRAHQVWMTSDMTSPRAEARGIGLCAASRAFETILKLTAIETYIREKVSGARNLAIHIVNGISYDQLRGALASGASDANARGFIVYHGSTILPTLKTEAPSLVTIPLAEIPDGFDAETERRDAYLRYANAIGVAVQDIQPLSGQGLGTGTQTVVLDEAAKGHGLAAWAKDFETFITHDVLPAATTFTWSHNDVRDRKAESEVFSAWAQAATMLVEKGVLSAPQAAALLIDKADLPREFGAADVGGETLEDDEKPIEELGDDGEPAAAAETPVEPAPPSAVARKATAKPITATTLEITDATIAAAERFRRRLAQRSESPSPTD